MKYDGRREEREKSREEMDQDSGWQDLQISNSTCRHINVTTIYPWFQNLINFF